MYLYKTDAQSPIAKLHRVKVIAQVMTGASFLETVLAPHIQATSNPAALVTRQTSHIQMAQL